jgi:hypothetical protein
MFLILRPHCGRREQPQLFAHFHTGGGECSEISLRVTPRSEKINITQSKQLLLELHSRTAERFTNLLHGKKMKNFSDSYLF